MQRDGRALVVQPTKNRHRLAHHHICTETVTTNAANTGERGNLSGEIFATLGEPPRPHTKKNGPYTKKSTILFQEFREMQSSRCRLVSRPPGRLLTEKEGGVGGPGVPLGEGEGQAAPPPKSNPSPSVPNFF